jgi:hypothetical protein
MVRVSPIPNREDHPASNHQGIQQNADGEYRLHSRSARRRRATEDDPGLIDQSPDGDGEKKRLKTLEDEQTPGAQQGEGSKSSLDLREHSSTGRQQSGNDRKHARPLWIRSHRITSPLL